MKLIILALLSIFVVACKTPESHSANILGNNITYQHNKDSASIEKVNLDASKKCGDLGYKKAKVSYTSCSNECITTYVCE
jgi:hypothetical protein